MSALAALAGATAGAALGSLGPAALRRLPEPDLGADEDPVATARHPLKLPYPELAAAPGLGLRLGVAAGTVGGLLGLRLGGSSALPAFVLAGVVGVWLGYVDLRLHLLPDRLGGPLLLGCATLLTGAAAVTGDWVALLRAAVGAVALTSVFGLLALLRPADMGFGDVKLARVLGLLLGWAGWGALLVGSALAFVLGGLAGLALVASGRAGPRTALPFGPFMLLGALLGVLVGDAVAAAYVGV